MVFTWNYVAFCLPMAAKPLGSTRSTSIRSNRYLQVVAVEPIYFWLSPCVMVVPASNHRIPVMGYQVTAPVTAQKEVGNRHKQNGTHVGMHEPAGSGSNQVTIRVFVPAEWVRLLVGSNRCFINKVADRTTTSIQTASCWDDCPTFEISGTSSNVVEAKRMIYSRLLRLMRNDLPQHPPRCCPRPNVGVIGAERKSLLL